MIENKYIIITDKHCILCNNCVKFMIKNNKKKRFNFSFFDSNFYKKNIAEKHPDLANTKSVLLMLPNGDVLKNSDAIISILSKLGGVYSFLIVLKIIPRFIRNTMYYYIAKNRKKWFGVSKNCTFDIDFPDIFYN